MPEVKNFDHWLRHQMVADRADFDIDEYLKRSTVSDDFNVREKLEQWKEIGVVVFEDAVDTALIDLLNEDIVFLAEHRKAYDLEIEFRGKRLPISELDVSPLSDTGIKFNCIENISLAARRLSLNRFVCGFLRHVFQDDVAVIQSLTFWKGSQQPAHLDYPWVCIQTKLPHLAASWIPLEDIHPDAGPLAYYPGTHKPNVIKPFDWGDGSLTQTSASTKTPGDFAAYLANEIARQNLQRQIFLPRRGDLLIWHGNVLHEGTQVDDPGRTRKSYVTHYTSLHAYPAEHKRQNQEATSLNGGFVFEHPWVTTPSTPLPSWSSLAV